MGFPTKMIILGWRLGGSPILRKHPSHWVFDFWENFSDDLFLEKKNTMMDFEISGFFG